MAIPKIVNTFALNLNKITMDDLNRLSTCPHLHLTLKKDGKYINPAILLNLIKQTSMSNMFAENTANPET